MIPVLIIANLEPKNHAECGKKNYVQRRRRGERTERKGKVEIAWGWRSSQSKAQVGLSSEKMPQAPNCSQTTRAASVLDRLLSCRALHSPRK